MPQDFTFIDLTNEFIKACQEKSDSELGTKDNPHLIGTGGYLPEVDLGKDCDGARFGNITIFPDDAAPPPLSTGIQALLAHGSTISVPDSINADDAANVLPKPVRRRGAGAKTWRPNPSFPMDDYEGMLEFSSHHGMSVGSFIVALCQAYVYCNPFILTQHLRPSMPPMTAEEYRTFSGMANNLNQIARVMNEGRKISIAHGMTYPSPPEELNALLQAIYVLLRVSR